MANICLNNIDFIASDKNLKELERLYNDVEKISKSELNFGHLDNVLDITSISNNYSYFIISTTTSWTPKPEIWLDILKDYSDIDLEYTSEESGCGIFVNTDESREIFEESYIAYYFDDDAKEKIIKSKLFKNDMNYDDYVYTTMRFVDDIEVINSFNKVLRSSINNIKDLVKLLELNNIGFQIHSYAESFL